MEAQTFQVTVPEGVAKLGIVPAALPPKPVILRGVEPGGWAEQNGITNGDELRAINDLNVTDITLRELDHFLRRARPVQLTFVRKKDPEIEQMETEDFMDLKRATTGDIEQFVEQSSDTADLLGTWVYGQIFEYFINRLPDGQLQFEESRVDHGTGAVKRVTGALAPKDGWHTGEIQDDDQRQLGWIRLRYVEDSGVPMVISNVRLADEEPWNEWSEDTVAVRKATEVWIHGGAHTQSPPTVGQAEQRAPALQVQGAQAQMIAGSPIWPEHWGITQGQCAALLRRLQQDPAWDSRNTVQDLVREFVVPWTRGSGLGYALQQNKSEPKEVNLMVSHSWSENAEDFLGTLLRSTGSRDVLFLCALSLYHAEDGVGPSISQQLGHSPEESPCRRVLQRIVAHGRVAGCRWRWRHHMHLLPALLAMLALFILYSPIIVWGCVPSSTGKQCLLRRIVEVGDLPQVQWTWSNEDSSDPGPDFLYFVPYPTAAGLLVLAVILWICLWRCNIYNGRLLAVPGLDRQLYCRPWCVHEIFMASTLGVPVVFANTLACTGRFAPYADPWTTTVKREHLKTIVQKDDYEQIGRVLRAKRRQEALAVLLAIFRWALLVIVFRSADQRLLSVSAGSLIGVSGLSSYFTGALGVLAGVVCVCLLTYLTGLLGRGAPRCSVIFGAAFMLVGSAGLIVGGLMYFDEIRHVPPENWVYVLDLFFDECLGHLRKAGTTVAGCSHISRFFGAFTQTLMLGSIILLAFLIGAFCCPPCVKGYLQVAALAVVVAATSLITSIYAETEFPDGEKVPAVVIFYLTAVVSRSVAPIVAMWLGVSRYGVFLSSRRRKSRQSSSCYGRTTSV